MKISINRRGLGALAVVLALVSGAAWALFYPAVQITAGPTPPTNICTNAPFTLPAQFNTSTTNSLTRLMFVPGVATFIISNIPLPTLNGPGTVTLNPPAYTVPAGTLITVTFKTFNSTGSSGGEAFESTIVFACDTGVISSQQQRSAAHSDHERVDACSAGAVARTGRWHGAVPPPHSRLA